MSANRLSSSQRDNQGTGSLFPAENVLIQRGRTDRARNTRPVFRLARRCLDRPVGGSAWGRPTRRTAPPGDLPMAAIRRASSLAIWPECRLDLETLHRRQRNCARLPKRFRQSRIDKYAPQRGNGRAVLFHRRISEGEEDKGFLETHILVISQSH